MAVSQVSRETYEAVRIGEIRHREPGSFLSLASSILDLNAQPSALQRENVEGTEQASFF